MKAIPISNILMIEKLDGLAQALLACPHTFQDTPDPDCTFASLRKLLKGTDSHNGGPLTYNYSDYTYRQFKSLSWSQKGTHTQLSRQLPDFATRKGAVLGSIKRHIPGAETDMWYYDTIAVYKPRRGFCGWYNGSYNPSHCFRFIYNCDKGFTTMVRNGRKLHVEDQQDRVNNINWTCLYGAMDGNTWVADRNSGQKPRVVIDIRVPLKYKPQAEVFEKFLRQN
tara:strand:+ start:1735 stop:2406 length:672 start_codon:yes stop_codon:yes gene_type:complete